VDEAAPRAAFLFLRKRFSDERQMQSRPRRPFQIAAPQLSEINCISMTAAA
jgi:hypothetical protein